MTQICHKHEDGIYLCLYFIALNPTVGTDQWDLSTQFRTAAICLLFPNTCTATSIYYIFVTFMWAKTLSASPSYMQYLYLLSALQQRIMLFKNVCQCSTSATWTTSNPSYLLSVLYIGFLLEMKWRFSPSKHSVICEKGNTKDHLQNGRRCWLMANTQEVSIITPSHAKVQLVCA